MIVVTPTAFIKRGDPIIVVACSTTIHESEYDRIRLPSKADTPRCGTGLTKPCWAVPRWFLAVKPERLTECVGHVGGPRLREIYVAWAERAAEKAEREGWSGRS